MSIVISVIERNEHFYIASDKRGIKKGIVRDNYQKIYQLSPGLYFGMTGIYEAGLDFFNCIKEHDFNDRHNSIDNINNLFDSFFRRKKPEKLAIMIAGRDNSGNFFIWQETIQGQTEHIKGSDKIELAISTNDKGEIYREYFTEQIILRINVKDAIIKTIKYASQIDSSISKEYELYEI